MAPKIKESLGAYLVIILHRCSNWYIPTGFCGNPMELKCVNVMHQRDSCKCTKAKWQLTLTPIY